MHRCCSLATPCYRVWYLKKGFQRVYHSEDAFDWNASDVRPVITLTKDQYVNTMMLFQIYMKLPLCGNKIKMFLVENDPSDLRKLKHFVPVIMVTNRFAHLSSRQKLKRRNLNWVASLLVWQGTEKTWIALSSIMWTYSRLENKTENFVFNPVYLNRNILLIPFRVFFLAQVHRVEHIFLPIFVV